MDNEQGFAPDYQDVIHEASVVIEGTIKAPDYSFGIGRDRKFFVEAKKPAVNIKKAPEPAYQLRRYAWSKKLPLSILTNFSEFAVYDGRVPPHQDDRSSVARISYFTYDQLPEKWDELAATYSKPAILKGSFDKFAQSAKGKRGTATVDALFLKEIEDWRLHIARNLALRNPSLDQRSLNYAVQMTIDRIIFLRMCEDRGIEDYGQLRDLAGEDGIYKHLKELFVKADKRFNSGLFHFAVEDGRDEPPDTITPKLKIDDKLLKTIIKRLYYPESPYVFSEIPPEILGQVYEQFLGKVITLTRGHVAKVEDKPEVKKAGGVYYTPSYIVDYIVKHTVGKLLEGKSSEPAAPAREGSLAGAAGSEKSLTPKQASKLRILDPACGSGSFLLGAYQYLLDWHRDWYEKNDPAKHPKAVYQSPAGWRLTTGERKRILINNIYGVDIDTQAVEVTKLSLLLKVLEGETRANLDRNLFTEHERALPDLSGNIKCGNSLIGPDFYDGKQTSLFDEEEQYRINVFDWNVAFSAIMKAGGFDAVIGNPPYVRMETFTSVKEYLRGHYKAHEERADLYAYFIERGLSLLNPNGLFGMIVSNKFIKAKYGRPLRSVIGKRSLVRVIADFAGARIFHGATVRTIVIIAEPTAKNKSCETSYVPVPDAHTVGAFETRLLSVSDYADRTSFVLAEGSLDESEWHLTPRADSQILEKMRTNSEVLSRFIGSTALFGLKTGFNEAFVVDQETRDLMVRRNKTSALVLKPILFGRDVRRYAIKSAGRYVIYCHPDLEINDFPPVREYLSKHRSVLSNRAGIQRWYELQQPATALIPINEKPKIVYPIISNECRFCLDKAGFFINDKLFVLPSSDLALLALLNSKLSFFYFSRVCAALEGAGDRYYEFRSQYVDVFPLPAAFSESSKRTELKSLCERMLTLHQQLSKAKTPHAQTSLQSQIDATDRQIDQIVYELYGLTPEEVRIVEAATGLASKSSEDEAGQPAGGNGDGYVPHQPSLDRGISPEMDRLNYQRIQLINRKFAGGLTPEEDAELERLENKFFSYLETIFPMPSILDDDRIVKLAKKYGIPIDPS